MTLNAVNPPSHFDEAWKEILDAYFQEFMEFFYPKLAENIDWSIGYQFMDKELQALSTDSAIGKRFVDKLVKIHSKAGQPSFVLLHTEVQGAQEEVFAQRLYTYHYRLRDRYQLPILTLAILADDNKNWRPDCYQDTLWNENILTFRFFINKLLDYEEKKETLLEISNPFGIVVAAHLTSLKTQPDPQMRLKQKLKLTRCLYEKGLARKKVSKLYYFIDAVMALPEDLELQYNDSIHALEQESKVAYITTAERIGIKKGLEEGRKENGLKTFRALLQKKFPDSPLDLYESEIAAADEDMLREWSVSMMDASSLRNVFGH